MRGRRSVAAERAMSMGRPTRIMVLPGFGGSTGEDGEDKGFSCGWGYCRPGLG
ncbi:MAG: hypothetical protein RI897_4128 [Verrucomicrobiota bacterium]